MAIMPPIAPTQDMVIEQALVAAKTEFMGSRRSSLTHLVFRMARSAWSGGLAEEIRRMQFPDTTVYLRKGIVTVSTAGKPEDILAHLRVVHRNNPPELLFTMRTNVTQTPQGRLLTYTPPRPGPSG